MTKLKPCPFCGGEAKIVPSFFSDKCRVGCNDYTCPMMPMTFEYSTKDEAIEAIKAWNTRADDAYSDDGK